MWHWKITPGLVKNVVWSEHNATDETLSTDGETLVMWEWQVENKANGAKRYVRDICLNPILFLVLFRGILINPAIASWKHLNHRKVFSVSITFVSAKGLGKQDTWK